MDMTDDYPFYVVELDDPPYSYFEPYVCIPNSWILIRTFAGVRLESIVIKYPVEDISKTKERAKNSEPYSDDWLMYRATIKYGTDSYENDVKDVVTTLQNKKEITEESRYLESPKYDHKLTRALRRSNRNHSLRQNTLQEPVSPSNCNTEPKSKLLQLTNHKIETHKKQTNITDTINSTNEVTKQMGDSSKSFNDEQQITTVNRTNYDKISDNVDATENNDSSWSATGNDSSVNHDTQELTNESLDSCVVIKEPIWGTENTDTVVKKMNDSFKKIYSTCDYMDNAFIQNLSILEKNMTLINKYYNIGSDDNINTTSQDTVTPMVEDKQYEAEIKKDSQVPKRSLTERGDTTIKETKKKKEDNYNKSYVKRKQHEPGKIILPPNHDKNNSKWTVRYHGPAPGLVELIEGEGVYINAVRLFNCKSIAKDSKTLAQLLLVEIFTERALSICSLTDIIQLRNKKPGLDKNAIIVLVMYVMKYANKKKWAEIDTKDILDSIRDKIKNIRSKYS